MSCAYWHISSKKFFMNYIKVIKRLTLLNVNLNFIGSIKIIKCYLLLSATALNVAGEIGRKQTIVIINMGF
jgi:hypothetical protein